MTRSISLLLLFILASFSLIAQEKAKVKKVYRPDIPGFFILDFGFNRASHSPENFNQGFWGSRTVNLYYQYPIRILKSKFSFNPGIGSSFERFKLKNNWTLSQEPNTNDGSFDMQDGNTIYADTRKSMIVGDYLDVPMDLRFDTNPEDRSRSFSVTIGGRAGLLYDAFTKIKHKEGSDVKVIKDKQDHGMNPYHYGMYVRIGGGGINVFGMYNFSNYFAKGKGPDLTTMKTFTIGISLSGF